MLLRDLQALLGELYAIELTADVRDFLVTDPAQLEQWQSAEPCDAEEKLLIHQDGDGVGLALFLDADLLDRLSARDPRRRLSRHNFADFCMVLEGISHFNYVAWNAEADKQVTLMELELQAEVDKYAGARALLQGQTGSDLAHALHMYLFERPRFRDDLNAESLDRYRSASEFAGRYCHFLERRYAQDRIGARMRGDLRRFFRLPQAAKVSHIRSAALR